jgi:nucleoprotein TPR
LDAVQQRAAALQTELEQARQAYAELQRTFEIERTAWINDKKTLEDAIVDMSTSEKNTESDRALRESEVREQLERAKVRTLALRFRLF